LLASEDEENESDISDHSDDERVMGGAKAIKHQAKIISLNL
jgi:hypothetical protein